ncbi:MAG TPA: FAD-dependent oxidoreductase [Verrucomicrobiae bacterium]|jgi:4-methylaminobutanoate oxidase (formaldehyde-forming)|nr:FAD-dependent oxidoreductase [Verrucomicrobiae bacterium]
MESSRSLPAEAKVVIVGGGVIGTSVAYHLTKLGWKDVVLLEQGQLGGGTSWHAAGLVGRLRTSNSMTRINKYTVELYSQLEQETGHSVGWKQVGSLIVAKSEDRMIQLRRTMAMAELFGVEAHLISAQTVLEKWPLLRVDDVLGAAWLPHDGKVIPKEVPIALARGASSRGARIFENVRVQAIESKDGRVTGVKTDQGSIKAEYVVLCGGMWTRELGLSCGVTIPLYPVEHHYVVTEPLAGAFDELPVGRDPDLCIYFRGEGDGVMLGAFQESSKPWMVKKVPEKFSFELLKPDWRKFSVPLANGKHRIPALANCKFAKFVNGPESFTPDNNFIMGEAPEMRHLFVAAGFNSVGIASAGGAGKYLAEWMLAGEPTLDLWSVDIRRFAPWANNRTFLRKRVTEVLGLHYQMAWPNREMESGRNLRRTPLHDRLARQRACFGSKNGWERPNWFATRGMKPVVEYSFGRQNWFDCHAREHRACRESVAIFDQTGFSKFLFKGPDALNVLQRLCGADMDVPLGKAVYTGMFNSRGTFESDITAIRLSNDEFYLISGTSQTMRDQDWIRRNLQAGEQAALTDVTEAYSVIGVMGPNSRALLGRVTDTDLSNQAFPFGTAQVIDIGLATVRAVRITYVGELGWELHVPMSQAVLVYESLTKAGKTFDVVNAGHYAINSLRLEKAYRAWGADISPDDSAIEAGLGFAIGWKKSAAFLGKDALLAQKQAGLKRQLVTFVLQDSGPMLWGSEPIYRNGEAVGYTTSGSYGHSLGAAVGMGYVKCKDGVTPEFIRDGRYEINVSGTRIPAVAHLKAPYDPERKKILG